MTIKAIETSYKGYRFRSRLEARWAVFFDACNLSWEYEPQGFDMNGIKYLPDFRVVGGEGEFWCEIKPTGKIEADDVQKLVAFKKAMRDFIVISGVPWLGEYELLTPKRSPKDPREYLPELVKSIETLTHCPLCNTVAPRSWYESFGSDTCGVQCMRCDVIDRDWTETDRTWFHKGIVETVDEEFITNSPLLAGAYQAARSARFEHGESGVRR